MPLRLNVEVTEDCEASGESAVPSARVSPVDTLVAAANTRGGGGGEEARLLTARSPPRAQPILSLSVTKVPRPIPPADHNRDAETCGAQALLHHDDVGEAQ